MVPARPKRRRLELPMTNSVYGMETSVSHIAVYVTPLGYMLYGYVLASLDNLDKEWDKANASQYPG